MKIAVVTEEQAVKRAVWKRRIRTGDPAWDGKEACRKRTVRNTGKASDPGTHILHPDVFQPLARKASFKLLHALCHDA